MKFIVSKDFFEKVPNAHFGVVIVKNFNNKEENKKVKDMLSKEMKEALEKLKDVKVKEEAYILPYREAFRAIDLNPNKFMCSIEALLTRISKGKDLPSINPIVDLGNALSVKYKLPIGIHDIDNFKGDIEIRKGKETDTFVPFGGGDIEHPEENEYVYRMLLYIEDQLDRIDDEIIKMIEQLYKYNDNIEIKDKCHDILEKVGK